MGAGYFGTSGAFPNFAFVEMFENCHHVQHYTVALSQLSCLATFSHGKLALVNIFFVFLFTTDLGGMIYCIVCIVLLFSTKMEAVPSVSR